MAPGVWMKVLSPVGWMPTKVKGVASSTETRIPLASIPSFSSSRRRKDPMKSLPIFVKIAAGIPMRASAEAVFTAPPPRVEADLVRGDLGLEAGNRIAFDGIAQGIDDGDSEAVDGLHVLSWAGLMPSSDWGLSNRMPLAISTASRRPYCPRLTLAASTSARSLRTIRAFA